MQTTNSSAGTSRTRSRQAETASSSRTRLPLVILALSILGIGIAGYLTYTHYDEEALVCAVGNCGTVQQSDYAKIGPIPISILGLGMYGVIAALALLRYRNWSRLSLEQVTIASWTITLTGLLYAGYLTYVELWVIDAVCQWCVASAIVTLVIFALESALLWRALDGGDAMA